MTIKQLIQKLSKLNSDLPVYFPNYTGQARIVTKIEKLDFIYKNEKALRDERTYIGDREGTVIKKGILLT